MPLIQEDEGQVGDLGQLSFRDRFAAGRVVPIISDVTIFDVMLGGYAAFVNGYASYSKSPAGADDDLVSLVKHYKHRRREKPLTDQALKFDYLNYVKNHLYRLARDKGADADSLAESAAQIDSLSVSEFASRLGYQAFAAGRDDPMLILANLPFKMVLTTSPFTFIEDALRLAGKQPRTEVCRWTNALRDSIPSVIDDVYRPGAQEPLVYHLMGLDRYVDSLVLTEDDFLDYLGNICQGQGNQAADFVPALVRKAFSDDLMVLGFSLDSWAFRVLYAGLIKRSGKAEDRGVCTIQLPDSPDERLFLEDYLQREAKFDVYWGSLAEYAQRELRQVG